jgi:hypothetical protein
MRLANFSGIPEYCLQRKPWRVAGHDHAKRIIGQALASTPRTGVRLEPLGHYTSRRNDIQVITLPAEAVYDLTVVSLVSKHAHTMSVPSQSRTTTHPSWSTGTLTLSPTTRSVTALAATTLSTL